MKLSTLVQYREQLEAITPRDVDQYLSKNHEHVLHTIQEHPYQITPAFQDLQKSMAVVHQSLEQYDQSLAQFKQRLQDDIEKQELHYMQSSYHLYEREMIYDTAEHVLDRRFELAPEQQDFVRSRVQFFSDFHHAGMLIRPGRESWITNMVACDPLYVVDESYDLLAHVKEYFPEQYVNRLRWTIINERGPEPWLHAIPDGQLGFCFAYNFFHYKPWEVIKTYLTEVWTKLRPGGTLVFTFNNCDRYGAVANAERNYMTYTPGRLMRGMCELLGYEIREWRDFDRACTWVEITKPGSVRSLKAGQTLARIIDKSK